MSPDWRAGHALLAARLRALPDATARTAARPLVPLRLGPAPIRRVLATGVGSSAAHAALLVHELRRAGRDAAVVPLSHFLAPAPAAPDDVLVVFSQGYSPNARLALARPDGWRRIVLVTAVTNPERLAGLHAAGVVVQTIDGVDEFDTLVRVIGPMTGYVMALRLAEALGGPAAPAFGDLAELLRTAAAPAATDDQLTAPIAFVTSGTYGDVVRNLQYKLMEGLLLPMPPAWDLLQLAHGPFQQRFSGRATFVALTRPDAPGEAELLARFASMLDPVRHALVRMPAQRAFPLALFEHEAALNALVLERIATTALDPVRWPGRDADGPLYGLTTRPTERRLARLAWPDVERRRPRLAIVPLGATEQHGPHLPFATDTLIADALGSRLAARCDDAIVLPALTIGCSVEHMAFPGTLDLDGETLLALLRDTLRSLTHHGISQAFVFSAHGGNVATLRAALPALAAAVPAIDLRASTDLDGLTARLQREAAAFGVGPEAAGHHAGEIETSVLLALHPELVRLDALQPGHVAPTTDAQSLFYPDLRRHAPDGTVGDPRGASALRGERYLAAWVDVLETGLRTPKYPA